ncbi:M23 family metallopeptidase [Tumebacillus algifaecis]|nr:M23 family metallopeptidase [Tumebacillus algifaecis]
MGKLTEVLNDRGRQIVAGSVTGVRNYIKNINWKQVKANCVAEVKGTFHLRNSMAALAVLLLTSVGVYTFSEKVAATEHVYRVYIDGQYYGVIEDKASIESTIQSLGTEMKAEVIFQPVHQHVSVTNEIHVANAIIESTKEYAEVVVVRVDGRDVVTVQDQETAEKLIARLKDQYVNPNEQEQVSLAETVDFIKVQDEVQKVTSFEAAFQLIAQGVIEQKTYVVSRGDSLWDIALKNMMSVEQLHDANPNIANIDAIGEGQEINLVAKEPLISVQTISEVTREITKNYEVEYRDDSSIFEGQEEVVQEGETGKIKQVVKITKKNGIVLKEDILKEEELAAPVKEIIAKGTKKKPTYGFYNGPVTAIGGGSWAYPVGGGYVSSYYGENRGGRPHLAIDIAASTGTAVYASNSGTVSYVGDAGDGYGNCIRISHGNGIVTLYGHLSSMAVSPGQSVGKGQYIGGVGSTGWSTGAHLHYEVRINGAQINPSPYM